MTMPKREKNYFSVQVCKKKKNQPLDRRVHGAGFISNPSDCFIGQRFSTKTHSALFSSS